MVRRTAPLRYSVSALLIAAGALVFFATSAGADSMPGGNSGGGNPCPNGYTHVVTDNNGNHSEYCKPPASSATSPPASNFKSTPTTRRSSTPAPKVTPAQPAESFAPGAAAATPTLTPTAALSAIVNTPSAGVSPSAVLDPKLVADTKPKDAGPNTAQQGAAGGLVLLAGAAAVSASSAKANETGRSVGCIPIWHPNDQPPPA